MHPQTATLKAYERKVLVVDITDGNKIIEKIIDIRFPWAGFVLVKTVTRNPEQPRKNFDLEELDLLAGSIETTFQAAPITAVIYETDEDPEILWMINDGERRLRALKINGNSYLWIAYNPLITVTNLFEASAISNLCRRSHTHMENAWAIHNLMRIKGISDLEVIGKQMGFKKAWTEQLYSLTKLHPSLQALLEPPTPKDKIIPIIAAVALASVDYSTQLEIWEKVREAPKRNISVLVRSLTGKSKAATSARPRTRSDDARVAAGQIKQITRKLKSALTLPDEIFEKIEGTKRPALIRMIDEAREMLKQLESKIGSSNDEVTASDELIEGMATETTPLPEEITVEDPLACEQLKTPADSVKKSEPAVKRVWVRNPTRSKTSSLAALAHAGEIKARPLPPGPHEIRPFDDSPPAQGTPAELPMPEPQSNPDEVLAEIRERIERERQDQQILKQQEHLVPVFGSRSVMPTKRILNSDEIRANIQNERVAARARIAPHQKVKTVRNTLTGLRAGTGFTDNDFADGSDYAHGAGG